MLAIVLALGSAVGYGGSDFAAGLAARQARVIRVVLLTQAASLIVVGLALPLAGAGPPGPRPVAWGMVAGLAGVSGAMALYLGFRYAAFSVAGPLSAVAAAGFSVLAGLLLGERPAALALAGIALALPAIVGVSASARASGSAEPATPGRSASATGRRVPAGVGYGLVAGVCFALLFIGLNRAGSGSGLWPVFSGQAMALATVGCLAAFTGDLRLPEARGGWLAALAGVIGAPGTILYFFATHRGLLAVAAVLSSLYPAVTIMLARILAGERLTAVRLTGLVLAAVSVALIAAGGSVARR